MVGSRRVGKKGKKECRDKDRGTEAVGEGGGGVDEEEQRNTLQERAPTKKRWCAWTTSENRTIVIVKR